MQQFSSVRLVVWSDLKAEKDLAGGLHSGSAQFYLRWGSTRGALWTKAEACSMETSCRRG